MLKYLNDDHFIKNLQSEAKRKKAVIGFDGFVDSIVRPIRSVGSADTEEKSVYFDTIKQFGEYLMGQSGKSCSVGLDVHSRQLGGNMPYLSRALGGLGIDVSCIGMLGGNGQVDPLFQNMPCTLYPFAEPGQSTCLEFTDGKVMLAPEYALTSSPWDLVNTAAGGKATELFKSADLITLVNWSELDFSHALWQAVYDNVLEGFGSEANASNVDKTRYAFFDLCDCSRKSAAEIHSVLTLIGKFAKKRTAVLSLNENESHIISEKLLEAGLCACEIGTQLRAHYGIDEVLIRATHDCTLITNQAITHLPTLHVKEPKILTGAGDNFNAAYCFGLLMGLSDQKRLQFSCEFTSEYIKHGI
ncbi:MAG: hypothetical protein LBN22_07385 [Clostridiales Family XIII bacterium]|jgi:hypothetical protein|nr:hypothetical protein [Clostridiales Family XIII bacterium]